jgi:tripartite-type tricarboxylate transporter receptor subunit TctC
MYFFVAALFLMHALSHRQREVGYSCEDAGAPAIEYSSAARLLPAVTVASQCVLDGGAGQVEALAGIHCGPARAAAMKGMSPAFLSTRIAFAIAVIAVTGPAPAQQYPAKPVRLLVPYPAGGGSDLIARAIAQRLSEKLGQSVVVDNRSGATGMIGSELAAKSAADGYTLLLGSVAEMALNPAVYTRMTYSPERDFAPIALVAISPLVLTVHPSLPARDAKQFIALAKKRPGEIGYATAGAGSPHHIAGEWTKLLAKIDIIHVPYKGGGPQLVDLMGGHVHSGYLALPVVAPHLKTGRLHALAVTSLRRSSALPGISTLDEAGLTGLDVSQWWGVLAPAGTPREIIARVQAEVADSVKMPEIRARMVELGAETVASNPEHFGRFIRDETAKFRRIVKDARIAVD